MHQVSKVVQAAEKKTCLLCTEQKGFWDMDSQKCKDAEAEGLLSNATDCLTNDQFYSSYRSITINNKSSLGYDTDTPFKMAEG